MEEIQIKHEKRCTAVKFYNISDKYLFYHCYQFGSTR